MVEEFNIMLIPHAVLLLPILDLVPLWRQKTAKNLWISSNIHPVHSYPAVSHTSRNGFYICNNISFIGGENVQGAMDVAEGNLFPM